ncbi:MAG: ubiquinol-cytochrome C chaperone [Sphingomonadales bacterium]|nr:ubiquinol-cytochrome C chaperone [Sphingomonadales bacterium]MBK9005082.1 ubiquinol-cytochrome C chaperone [Sphingomonadales bacterium]MBK9267185.1 ubiquinol-cytochrome C chaperone [Sphingomonadales bacterium]MBP6433473.1 ubiquinol-cytochrome C chaperone [Sphingorhabdus sp.]
MSGAKSQVSLLRRLFGPAEPDPREALRPLYDQIVAQARRPVWYLDGGVPDTVDGRFEMVSVTLSLVLIRLEKDSAQAQAMAFLTEIFIDDMDAQLREFGVGDMVVGKRIGKLLGAFGGRLGAYREALADGASPDMLPEALRRNLYGEIVPTADQLDLVVQGLRQASTMLAQCDAADIMAGQAKW